MPGLPWIKVWTVVPLHPKIQRLERELSVEDGLGIVVRLWCWTADYCPSGDIPSCDVDAMLEVALGRNVTRNVTRNAVPVGALVSVGILDAIPTGYRVHDWYEMQTVHVDADEKRKTQARERQARFRKRRNVTVTRDITRDVTRDVTLCNAGEGEGEGEGDKIPTPEPQSGSAPKPRKPRKPRVPPDPSLGALTESLSATYLEIKGEGLDWPGSAHGDLQAIRKSLGNDDAELARRWACFLRDTKFWPLKSINRFRVAHSKYKLSAPPASEFHSSIPVFRG